MILILIASLLSPPKPTDIFCPTGMVRVILIDPEYKYQCAWPEQLTDAIEPKIQQPLGAVPLGMSR
jgi:hypothetical protein